MIDVNTCLIISRITAQLPTCKYRMKTLGKTPKITLGMSAGHNLGHNLQYVRNLKDLFKSWCTSCVCILEQSFGVQRVRCTGTVLKLTCLITGKADGRAEYLDARALL